MAAATPGVQASTPTNSRLHLFAIPPELFDLILGFAYGRAEEVRLIPREWWEEREQLIAGREARQMAERRDVHPLSRQRNVHRSRPFPEPVVSNSMVCKAFLVKAAEVYVSSGPINLQFELKERLWRHGMVLIAAFAKDIAGILEHGLYLPPMAKLQRLRLSVDEDFLYPDDESGRSVTGEESGNDQVTRWDLCGVSKSVSLELSPCAYDIGWMATEEQEVHLDNIQMLQVILQARIRSGCSENWPQGSRPDPALYASTQLYPGFKVTFDVSCAQGGHVRAIEVPSELRSENAIPIDGPDHTPEEAIGYGYELSQTAPGSHELFPASAITVKMPRSSELPSSNTVTVKLPFWTKSILCGKPVQSA